MENGLPEDAAPIEGEASPKIVSAIITPDDRLITYAKEEARSLQSQATAFRDELQKLEARRGELLLLQAQVEGAYKELLMYSQQAGINLPLILSQPEDPKTP
jgi:hypothetical protein